MVQSLHNFLEENIQYLKIMDYITKSILLKVLMVQKSQSMGNNILTYHQTTT